MYAIPMKRFLLFLFLSTPQAYAENFAEYGFTPSHVYTIWSSIHTSILKLSEKYPSDAQNEIKNIKRKTYKNKIPAEVLNETNIFTRKLNSYRQLYNLPEIELRKMHEDALVTPSIVYINSGRLQDELANTIKTVNPAQEISTLYHSEFIPGKQPRDVYSLVELATEEIKVLIKYEKSQK